MLIDLSLRFTPIWHLTSHFSFDELLHGTASQKCTYVSQKRLPLSELQQYLESMRNEWLKSTSMVKNENYSVE